MSGLVRRLVREFGLHGLAVFLAVVLWVQAATVQNPVDRFTFDGIPVVAVDVPQGMVISAPVRPAKINVTVKCRRRVGERLTASSFQAKVSLAGAHPGTADFPVELERPDGVELVEMSPAAVTVTLERLAEAVVPVEPRLAGACPEGYAPGEPAVSPTTLVVRGAASAVAQVARVVAELDLGGATADKTGTARLAALDVSGSVVAGVTFEPATVTVTVPVTALPAAESVDVDAVLVGSPAPGYAVLRIACNPSRVQVRPVPGGVIDFDHVVTEPVDISGLTSDVRVRVALAVPSGVASVNPSQVEVVVEIEASRSLGGLPVTVRNLAPGLVATVSPGTVDLVVRGPRALTERLVPGDVVAWVDAAGRTVGQSTVRVNVAFPEWAEGRLEASMVSPAEVTLVIGR